MDPDQIAQRVRARFDHNRARQITREKYQAKMIFAHAGGMWQAGPDLQTMLMTCPDDEAVILDLYSNPIKIKVKELYTMSQQRWQEQMTAWLLEHETINQQR